MCNDVWCSFVLNALSNFAGSFFASAIVAIVFGLWLGSVINKRITTKLNNLALNEQRKDYDRNRIVRLVDHIGILEEEAMRYAVDIPDLFLSFKSDPRGTIIICDTPAFDSVLNNSEIMSGYSSKLSKELTEIQFIFNRIRRHVDLIVSMWLLDTKSVPEYQEKMARFHKAVLDDLEFVQLRISVFRT